MSVTAFNLANSTPGYTPGYTVVVPAHLPHTHPTTQVIIRRRLLVALVLFAVVVGVWLGAGSVLANRGGEPASAAAVRPAISYIVQPGDTLWSIAAHHHGPVDQATYVDVLVQRNGGSIVQVGQVLSLP